MTLSHIQGTGFEVIVAGAIATVSAQVFKILINLLWERRLNFRLFVETGGMPSSHTAMMTAQASSVGLVTGWDSVIFAVALGMCLVVMYDAAGVRRAAGKMAGIMNQMAEDIYLHHPDKLPERLRELLGHTPIEVMAGAMLGIATAYLVHVRV